MSKQSAGILLYRRREGRLEVFLVHMGGPFWQRKDQGAWTIPKGEYEAGEDPQTAALREFREETGFQLSGELQELEPVRQSGGKIVRAWAIEGDADPAALVSNTFELEWPPRSGRWQSFPEVDRGAWLDPDTAREKIIPAQRVLIDQLEARLGM